MAVPLAGSGAPPAVPALAAGLEADWMSSVTPPTFAKSLAKWIDWSESPPPL